ncbi:MAG: hypothetical protein EOO36_08435 [Cytophagaceae bacterium]|nr:MAG: hypothetical protein EOO36_08435 [Cytophagaceae bacterium]
MKYFLYLALLVLLSGPGHAQRPVYYSAPVYKANLAQLTAKRTALAARYRQAATPAAQAACLAKARELWLNALDNTVFPAWESTPWSFYGQSWVPRQGTIACGYFVTTALFDTGLRLRRSLLAKQGSETLIKNLTTETHIHRYRHISQRAFVQQVADLGPGLYVVGLDFHVGFLRVREGGAVQMVHASWIRPARVIREAADSSPALPSKYRVVGKLSDDDNLLRAWLLGEVLAVRGATVKS